MIVRSRIYSMDFWLVSSIELGNVKFERLSPWDQFNANREMIMHEGQHAQTGWLEIVMPEDVNTVEEARKIWREVVNQLHIVLPLAHGHDVPIREMIVYQPTVADTNIIADEVDSMWFGKAGASSNNVYSHGLGHFLEVAVPLLFDEQYNEKTNISLAATYYNGSINSSFLETKFILLWMGLEAMAGAFYDEQPADLGLARKEWRTLKAICNDYLRLIHKESVFPKFVKELDFLRQGSTKEKILYLLRNDLYRLERYSEFINEIYEEIRNPMVHGRTVDWDTNINNVFRLKRILEKIIFKCLCFYQDEALHYAIKQEDLLAI